MRIHFNVEGGLAFFPNLNKPVTIDVDELPPEEAGELEELLDTAKFFDLPKSVGEFAPGAADYRRYKVTIENEAGDRHSVQFADVSDNPEARKLLDFLLAKISPIM